VAHVLSCINYSHDSLSLWIYSILTSMVQILSPFFKFVIFIFLQMKWQDICFHCIEKEEDQKESSKVQGRNF
jgi:hypothetical protein